MLSGDVSPEQAYRAQTTENAWREIDPVTRFAFFGSPPVPVLYAAATAEAAISETILYDVPLEGGRIDVDLVQSKTPSPVISSRNLRLLSLHGNRAMGGGREHGRVRRDRVDEPAPRHE